MMLPFLLLCCCWAGAARAGFVALDPSDYRENFVEGWPGPWANGSGAGEVNESTFAWAAANLPLFEVSDPDMQAAYYYRAKSYHSHMNPTEYVDQPVVVSEFGAAVHWGGPYGSINAASGHHISEGRWIRDPTPMHSNIKFWLGSMGSSNKQLTPHFANGSTGHLGSTPYSEWVLTAVARRSAVLGDFELGLDKDGKPIDMHAVLEGMIQWWEAHTRQTRLDCAMVAKNGDPETVDCAAAAPGTYPYPYCYIIDDGWDAMEGSISSDGCRPTVGAMKYGDALAIAELATQLGNSGVARVFTQRAGWIQSEYLKLLWNPEIEFFAVYKENLQGNGKFHCSAKSSSRSVAAAIQPEGQQRSGNKPGCPIEWPCNKPAGVRELLGLGPPYYFGIVPKSEEGATKYDVEWAQLDDPMGFLAPFGPTTAERRSPCFNQTQDSGECNWAGPSWPYETARVLTGLANFLIEYPKAQSLGANVTPATFTRLLRTYAQTHTRSSAANGTRQEPPNAPPASRSQPWVGENVEPDKGYWMARQIMYRGGNHPQPVNCALCKSDPRPRNCGNFCPSGNKTCPGPTGGWDKLPNGCCNPGAKAPCDGKVIPTPDKVRATATATAALPLPPPAFLLCG